MALSEEQRTYAMESMRKMVQNLPTKRDLAWAELKAGTDPAWVAHKYGFEVERMIAAKKTLTDRTLSEIELAKR